MKRWKLILLLLSILLIVVVVYYISYINSLNNQLTFYWDVSDICTLDPVDSMVPQVDIIASYIHVNYANLILRFDLLDIDPENLPSITISIYPQSEQESLISTTNRDEIQTGWITRIVLPSNGNPILENASPYGDFHPIRVIWNSQMDYVEVWIPSVNLTLDPNDAIYYATASQANQANNEIADSVGFFRMNDNPITTAPVLLEFWNTLPSSSLAQTLRSWNGAHAGPYGRRHGLEILLESSSHFGIPVFLLDLKTPDSLMALSYLGSIDQIRRLEQENLVVLPQVIYGPPDLWQYSLNLSRRATETSNLYQNQMVYSSNSFSSTPPFTAFFTNLLVENHIFTHFNTLLIPLPINTENNEYWQIFLQENMLSMTLREQLVTTALSRDPSDLVILGGSLSDTIFADSVIAPIFFEYLASHPWIHVLSENDLSSFPARQLDNGIIDHFSDITYLNEVNDYSNCSANIAWIGDISSDRTYPPGVSRYLRWIINRVLESINNNQDSNLNNLANIYCHQYGYAQYVYEWGLQPHNIQSCSVDVDNDGQFECVLADEKTLLIIEQRGGYLAFAATWVQGFLQPWIIPSSFSAFGLSDPSRWHFGSGMFSDPAVIPGAFLTSGTEDELFLTTFGTSGIILTSEDGLETRTFNINSHAVSITLTSPHSITTSIPFYDPGMLIDHACENPMSDSIHSVINQMETDSSIGDPTLRITVDSYCDSAIYMHDAENPETDFPPGHYLPFGIIRVTIETGNNLSLHIPLPR